MPPAAANPPTTMATIDSEASVCANEQLPATWEENTWPSLPSAELHSFIFCSKWTRAQMPTTSAVMPPRITAMTCVTTNPVDLLGRGPHPGKSAATTDLGAFPDPAGHSLVAVPGPATPAGTTADVGPLSGDNAAVYPHVSASVQPHARRRPVR